MGMDNQRATRKRGQGAGKIKMGYALTTEAKNENAPHRERILASKKTKRERKKKHNTQTNTQNYTTIAQKTTSLLRPAYS